MNKILFIVRGLPGSGKTTLSNKICDTVYAADDYFYDKDGNYNFDVNRLGAAHKWCEYAVKTSMETGIERIAVNNTFTREREMKPYLELANKYGYTTFSLIVENRHGNNSVHNVPKETLKKMENRFSIKLR